MYQLFDYYRKRWQIYLQLYYSLCPFLCLHSLGMLCLPSLLAACYSSSFSVSFKKLRKHLLIWCPILPQKAQGGASADGSFLLFSNFLGVMDETRYAISVEVVRRAAEVAQKISTNFSSTFPRIAAVILEPVLSSFFFLFF